MTFVTEARDRPLGQGRFARSCAKSFCGNLVMGGDRATGCDACMNGGIWQLFRSLSLCFEALEIRDECTPAIDPDHSLGLQPTEIA